MPGAREELVERRLEHDYWCVVFRRDGIVVLERREVPFRSIAELHKSYDKFLASVDDWLFDLRIKSGQLGTRSRPRFGWCFDLRKAPDMRNDPAFEEAIKERRPELLKRSEVLAILVQTSAGQMQLNRITQREGASIGVFNESDEAESWLLTRMREVFD